MARTDLAPEGKVFVHGELWHARADAPVAAGTPVEVVAVEGLMLRVRSSMSAAAPLELSATPESS